MLGLISVLRSIVTELQNIVTQLTAIAENTTPTEDTEPEEPGT